MKKLFTTLALGAFGIAALQAQIFTVTIDGKEVKNGETVSSSHVEAMENPLFDSSKPEDISNPKYFMWELKPEFKVNFASDANVYMTVTNKSETLPISDCGIGAGSSCRTIQPGGELLTEHKDVKAGELIAQVYYNHADVANLPTSLDIPCVVKLQAESEDDTQEFEFNLNLVYSNEPGAVNGIAGDDLSFAVENGRVVASDNSAVEVYTFSGVRVANENLNGLYIVRAAGKTAKVAVK